MSKLPVVCVILLIVVATAAAQEVEVATSIAFTEGPTADAAGNIFFTDQTNNRIMKLSVDSKLSTFRQPANYANGLVFDPQWHLLACESGDPSTGIPSRITRTYLETGRIEILADNYEGKRFVAPNDITFDGPAGFISATSRLLIQARVESFELTLTAASHGSLHRRRLRFPTDS